MVRGGVRNLGEKDGQEDGWDELISKTYYCVLADMSVLMGGGRNK